MSLFLVLFSLIGEPQPITWQSFQGQPWVAGIEPEKQGRHTVLSLMPGQFSRFRLDDGEFLLAQPKGKHNLQDLHCFTNSSGDVFRRVKPQNDNPSEGMILGGPGSRSVILHVPSGTGLSLRLFHGKPSGRQGQHWLALSDADGTFADDPEHPVSLLPAQQEFELSFHGPTQVKVYTYLANKDEVPRAYDLLYAMGDQWHAVRYQTSPRAKGVWFEGREMAVGQGRILTLDVPAGTQTLRMKSSGDVFLRVSRQKPMLFERFNNASPQRKAETEGLPLEEGYYRDLLPAPSTEGLVMADDPEPGFSRSFTQWSGNEALGFYTNPGLQTFRLIADLKDLKGLPLWVSNGDDNPQALWLTARAGSTLAKGTFQIYTDGKLTLKTDPDTDLDVCLQQQMMRPIRLDEARFSLYASQLGENLWQWALGVMAGHSKEKDGLSGLAQEQLGQHFKPLFDLVKETGFAKNLVPLTGSGDLDVDTRHAEALVADGRLVEALAAYTQLIDEGGSQRLQLCRARILAQLGEHVLARRLLSATMWFAENPELRDLAYRQLRDHYGKTRAGRGQLRVAAARVERERTPQHMEELARVLLSRGQDFLAQSALLLVPDAEPGLRAEIAHKRQWPEMWASALREMEPQHQAWWRGFATDDAWEEKGYWADAGDVAVEERKRLMHLRKAQQMLASQEPQERFEGLLTYETAPAPSDSRYTDASLLVFSAAGGTLELGKNRTSFLASKLLPLEARVPGPARLRLQITPIAQEDRLPAGCWLHHGEGRFWVPFEQKQGLQVFGHTNKASGVATYYELALPAGYHRVRVIPEGGEQLAVRLHREVARFEGPEMPWTGDRAYFAKYFSPPPTSNWLPELDAARLALRMGTATPHQLLLLQQNSNIHEAPLLFMKGGKVDGHDVWLQELSRALADRSRQRILALVWENRPERDLHHMAGALSFLAQDEQSWRSAMVRVAALQQEFPQSEAVSKLMSSFKRTSRWVALKNVLSHGGLQTKTRLPETANPFIQVRQALIPQEKGSQWVWASDKKTLHFVGQGRRTKLELALQPSPALASEPLKVSYRWNQGAPKELRLDSETQTVRVSAKKGENRLRLYFPKETSGAFVKVKAIGASQKKEKRTWFRATRSQPVVVVAHEPTWLRVTWLNEDGKTRLEQKFLKAGTTLRLKPSADQKRAWLRLARRMGNRGGERAITLIAQETPKRQIFSPSEQGFSESGERQLVSLFETKGSWEVSLANRQKQWGDDEVISRQKDPFQALSATYRFKGGDFGHGRVRMRYRLREDGNDTTALDATHFFQWKQHQFRASLSAFSQNGLDSGSDPYAATARFSWWHHRAISARFSHTSEAMVFGRHLSLSRKPQAGLAPDLDVYSNYKRDHDHGLQLTESVYFQPYADMRLRLRAHVLSNEKFGDPDRYGLDLDYYQLLGSWQMRLGVSARSYQQDEHRTLAYNTTRAIAELRWRTQRFQRRWEAGMRLQMIEGGALDTQFFVSHLFGAPGNYQHHGPGEILFRNLKRQRNMDQLGGAR